MSWKFKTSGVLTSGVDYFCLVCECRLHHEAVAIAHVEKPVHTKKFDATEYFENKDNYVRKINKWYFCELCNLLLPTAARVRLHVSEPQHLENTSARILQRTGTCVVAFSSVQIDDKSWHGIIDKTCVICNMEFDDPNIHINETNHIIKLIQSKTEFDSYKNIFRKVDESSVQCITCNMIIGVNSIDIHFKDTEHRNLYQRCCDTYETTIKNSAPEKVEVVKSNIDNDKYESNEGSQILEKEDSCINKTSLCIKPVKNSKNDDKVQDVKKDKSDPKVDKVSCDVKVDIENYIKQNYMTRHSDNNVYCTKCISNIPYSLRSLKEHVTGAGHQRKVNDEKVALVETKSKHSAEANLIKVKVDEFIKNFQVFEGSESNIIINDNICIALYSMLLLINIGVKLKCLSCDEELHRSRCMRHMKGHHKLLDESLVVMSKKHNNEFIREFRPGHFHCGYCNTWRDSWQAMESHLQSQEHKGNKTTSAWRLKEFSAQLFMQNMQREVDPEAMFGKMVHHLFQVDNN